MSMTAILPAVNATLNALSACLLIGGYACIRRGRRAAHQRCMLSAFLVSILFLAGYLTLRYFAGMTRFTGQGWIRPVYFTILLSHTALAAGIVPLALVTVTRALREEHVRHVRIARWTLPLWLYVSITGVVIFWLLYHLYPGR
jgi:uncharacterized membrane protein YozB (DUF420 family)